MISREFAERFAKDWVDAWNRHDLEAVLSHYADDFEMSSPYIVHFNVVDFLEHGSSHEVSVLLQRAC